MTQDKLLIKVNQFKDFFQNLKNKVDVLEIREELYDDPKGILNLFKDTKERHNYKLLKEDFASYIGLEEDLGVKYFFHDNDGGGEFNLHWICGVLNLFDYDEGLGYEGQPEEEAKLFKTFRVIDSHPDAGDNKWGVISLVEGHTPPNEPDVYFVDRGRAFNMNMKYGDYINGLLETYAIYNWQYLYCDIDLGEKSEFSYIYDSLDKGINGLINAFPDKDFSKLRGLLESKRIS